MISVCLLYVGIVLILNGIGTLCKCDPKAVAVMNFFTGGLSVIINVINLVQGNYYAAATGLLFGFTYLFVGINNVFRLEAVPVAWFSAFVAVNAVVFGTMEGFVGIPAQGISPDARWGVIWYLWAVLWATSFIEVVLKKSLGKLTPCLQIFEGVTTAWLPAIALLLGVW
ncbi:MAG: acid-activated urea channel [Lachnospiraceae bacterium]|nr:acid-activated urea channel [Lachnospiraceae bacterium]